MAALLLVAALAFHGWGMSVGWESKSLPGVEYRQAQTALSAYFIKQEGNFSLAYPTPVLGKPWSVPMEFPLYQWTVVLTGHATGLGLVKSGRLVSMVCFYLTLPALYLLLGRWQVAPGRRWLVLAVVTSCPFYVFYARAFLIETMALMFALWYWVAFERAVKTRRGWWLAIAVLAGAAAGLVKVTTLMLYLLPAGAWALVRLGRGRADGRWRRDLPWLAAATALPLLAAGWWVLEADRIKALNPMADFLGSAHMRDFNLGTTALRLSPELWAMKWRIIRDQLTWLPALGLAILAAPVGGRHRLRAVVFCLLVFLSALWVFPVLYAYHDYYYVASAVALLLAAGLAVVGLVENPRWRVAGLALAAAIVAAQMWWYGGHYRPQQAGISAGGSRLTEALRRLTAPGEVLVIVGEDWNSMTPYYAQRRALMLRGDVQDAGARIDDALRNLAGETIGALLVTGQSWQERTTLIGRLAAAGLAARPLLHWRDTWVFFRREQEPRVVQDMEESELPELEWAPGAAPISLPLAGRWSRVAELPGHQRRLFASMQPKPVRFFSSYEPARQVNAGEHCFSAHPLTRLVFALPKGAHTLRTQAWFNPGSYAPPSGEAATDGVEIRLSVPRAGTEPQVLATRLLTPLEQPADRGVVPVRFDFTLERDAEVELMFGPGPQGRDTRDWIWLRGALTID